MKKQILTIVLISAFTLLNAQNNGTIIGGGTVGGQGADGEGVVAGGTTGQVLAKASNTDYDTEWIDQTGGDGLLQDKSVTDGYTFIAGDEDDIITYNSASDGVINIPTNASVPFAVGTILTINALGDGNVVVNGSATSSSRKLIQIKKTATDTWRTINDYSNVVNASTEPTITGTQVPNTASFVADVDMLLKRFYVSGSWYYFWVQIGS